MNTKATHPCDASPKQHPCSGDLSPSANITASNSQRFGINKFAGHLSDMKINHLSVLLESFSEELELAHTELGRMEELIDTVDKLRTGWAERVEVLQTDIAFIQYLLHEGAEA